MKPSNVLIDSDGHIKLIDFGLSKAGIGSSFYLKFLLHFLAKDLTKSFKGTSEYVAPEILLGLGHNKSVD